jgi:hypothetical protein
VILYRTSSQKRRNSIKFLANMAQQTAVLYQLEKTDWIDEIFSRQTPIPPEYPSRFGPPGFSEIPFYCSQRRETTFYEFGWGLLKYKSILNLAVSAVCYDVKYKGAFTINAELESNIDQIRDPNSYLAAHAWLKSLHPIPDSIRYPAVRDPSEGEINFAIYARNAIESTTTETEEFTITPINSKELEIVGLPSGQSFIIAPIQ